MTLRDLASCLYVIEDMNVLILVQLVLAFIEESFGYSQDLARQLICWV